MSDECIEIGCERKAAPKWHNMCWIHIYRESLMNRDFGIGDEK